MAGGRNRTALRFKTFLTQLAGLGFTPYIICAPATILLVFFFLVPAVTQLSMSFFKYIPPGTVMGKFYEPTFTVENYVRFSEPTYVIGYLWPTIKIMFASTILGLVLSYPLAYSIARSSPRSRKIFTTLAVIALLVGPIVRVYSWLIVLGRDGIINDLISFLGFNRIKFLGTELGVIIGTTQFLLAFLIFSLSGSIQNIDPSFEDAARSLGASDVHAFMKVTLPLSLPGISSAVLIGLTLGATMLETPMILGQGITEMQANLVFKEALFLNYPFAAVASIVLITITLGISYGANYLLKTRIKWMKQGQVS